jgi:hypothetical protein
MFQLTGKEFEAVMADPLVTVVSSNLWSELANRYQESI